MKESLWGYFVLLFGVFIIVIMMIIRDYQTTNDEDYYLMKEVTQAAMIDAVDYAYYRDHNDIRIVEEKFVENFLRRFAESMGSNKNYKIQIYELSETPPKVSVRISSSTNNYLIRQDEGEINFGVVNVLSAILDMKHDNAVFENDSVVTTVYRRKSYTYYTTGYVEGNSLITMRWAIDLKYLPYGIEPGKVVSTKVEPGIIETKGDFLSYVTDKINGIMVSEGSKIHKSHILTDWNEFSKYALTSKNLEPSGKVSCSSEGCRLNATVKINNIDGVPAMPTYVVDVLGEIAHNIRFVPTKYTVTFTYKD